MSENLKFRKIIDSIVESRMPQWNLTDKIDQSRCIEMIFQLSFDFERKKSDSKRIIKQQQLNELRRTIEEMKSKLADMKNRECDMMKNLLKDYKSSNRLRNNSSDGLLENCDYELLNKRKISNRLNYEMNELSNAYASKLNILNKLQNNNQKRGKSHQMKVKNLTESIDKSETQIQNNQMRVNDLKHAIRYLSDEQMQYRRTLTSLENELNEQKSILNAIKLLNIPSSSSSTVDNKTMINKKPSQLIKKRMKLNVSLKNKLSATNDVNVEINIHNQNKFKQQQMRNNLDKKHGNVEKVHSAKERAHEIAYQEEPLRQQTNPNEIPTKPFDENKFKPIFIELFKIRETIRRSIYGA